MPAHQQTRRITQSIRRRIFHDKSSKEPEPDKEPHIDDLSRLPTEIRMKILNFWIIANPPEIDGQGNLYHPILDAYPDGLPRRIYLNLFHSTPLIYNMQCTRRHSKCWGFLRHYLHFTPELRTLRPDFLALHDATCGRPQRHRIRLHCRLVQAPSRDRRCKHARVAVTAQEDRWHYEMDEGIPRCQGWCSHQASTIWSIIGDRFLTVEGLGKDGFTVEIFFRRGTVWERIELWWAWNVESTRAYQILYGLGVIFCMVLLSPAVLIVGVWDGGCWVVRAFVAYAPRAKMKARRAYGAAKFQSKRMSRRMQEISRALSGLSTFTV